jgi:O-antigen ligase
MTFRKGNFLVNNRVSSWQKVIEVSIILLVILVPLALYPYCKPIFGPAKNLVFELLTVFALACWGFRILERGKCSFRHFPLDLPIFCIIIYTSLSLFWSDSFFVSLKALPLFLAGPLLYFVITNNINHGKIKEIVRVVVIMGALFGIYGIFQYLGIDFTVLEGNQGRVAVTGLFGNINYYAEYLVPIFPLALSLFFSSEDKLSRILLFFAFLAIGGGIIFTFTRSAYLGSGVAIIFVMVLMIFSRGRPFIRKNKKLFIVGLLLIVLIALLFIIPNPLDQPGTYISKIKGRVSLETLKEELTKGRRIATWKFTGMMIRDHLLFGSGIGTFKYNSLQYQAEFFNQGDNRSLYPYGIAHETHNEYLQFWAEIGVVGLGLLLWIMMSCFYWGLKYLKKIKKDDEKGIIIGLMGGIIAVLLDGIFGFPLHLPATLVLFWLYIGLTMSISILAEDKKAKAAKELKGKVQSKITMYHYKPLLYLGIITIFIFLCVHLSGFFIARIYWYWGTKEVDKGNFDKVIDLYEKALTCDPYLGSMYYGIGEILMYEKKDYTRAEFYYIKAREYTDYPKLPQNLAFIYLQKGELEKAVQKLKQAITYQETEEAMFPFYFYLGRTYMSMMDYNKAEQSFQQAVRITSNSKDAHFGLAQVSLKLMKRQIALSEFQKVIQLDPKSKEAEYARKIIEQLRKFLNK